KVNKPITIPIGPVKPNIATPNDTAGPDAILNASPTPIPSSDTFSNGTVKISSTPLNLSIPEAKTSTAVSLNELDNSLAFDVKLLILSPISVKEIPTFEANS